MRKRMLMMLLAGTMSIGALVGCGKSEEKAADEIAEHIKDEAAADGVDIDKMIAEEQAGYEERQAEAMDKSAAQQEMYAFAEEKFPELESAYNAYLATKSSSEVRPAADAYNKAYETYEAEYNKRAEETGYTDDLPEANIYAQGVAQRSGVQWTFTTNINDERIADREHYLDNCYEKEFNKIQFYQNSENDVCVLRYKETEDMTVSDVGIIYSDGTVYEPDLSCINEGVQNVYFYPKKSGMIIGDAFSSWAYEFTLDSPTGTSLNLEGYPEEEYTFYKELFENTLEKWNAMEVELDDDRRNN